MIFMVVEYLNSFIVTNLIYLFKPLLRYTF